MKKILISFLCCIAVTASVNAQTCEYSGRVQVAGTPYALRDAAMQTFITNLGYTVTVAADRVATSPSTYSFHLLSNTLGSADAAFATLKETKEPVVMLKTWGLKSTAGLCWTAQTTAGVNMNSLSVTETAAGSTHFITQGLATAGTIELFSAYGTTNDGSTVSTAGVEGVLPTVTELSSNPLVTILATVTANSAGTTPVAYTNLPVIVAFEKGATLNGVTLTKRAVMIGINMESWANLTVNALTIITRAIAWATENTSAISNAISPNILKKAGNELMNTTNLEVEVYSAMGVKLLTSSDATISISSLPNGFYVAKTAQGTLSFIK